MRFAPHPLLFLLALGLGQAAQAGAQTGATELDLNMLDMNGSPFRTFHLGLYAKGLDSDRPAAATPLPSEELQQDELAAQEDSVRYTGVSTSHSGALPDTPDITPLLQSYDPGLLQPAGGH